MEKIDSILDEKPNPWTTVILLSALYFKGEWNQHFMGAMTRRYMILSFISTDRVKKWYYFYFFHNYEIFSCRKEFFIEPNDTVEVDMMYNGGNFPFYEDKALGVKILALPYKGLEVNIFKY